MFSLVALDVVTIAACFESSCWAGAAEESLQMSRVPDTQPSTNMHETPTGGAVQKARACLRLAQAASLQPRASHAGDNSKDAGIICFVAEAKRPSKVTVLYV